ncbi:MAG: hypothetical protein KBF45_08465 [Cyclobacteriaceae bacterium]|nr:hypothetical protein [Cyclobacteriaceae bacterium]
MKNYFFTMFLVANLVSFAQVPGTLSYQGILMQNDGITPLTDGTHSIVFSFYNVGSGGSSLFTRTISVTTSRGLYTCIIGGGTAPNAPFNSTEMNQIGSQQIYIGIKVDAGIELLPRAQLTTSAYTYQAQSAYSMTNGFVGGSTEINTSGNISTTGFTKHGEESVAVKTCLITGTTSGSQGSYKDFTLCGGITLSKILSISVVVTNANANLVPPSLEFTSTQSSFYWYVIDPNILRIRNGESPTSADVLNKAFKAYVTYIE